MNKSIMGFFLISSLLISFSKIKLSFKNIKKPSMPPSSPPPVFPDFISSFDKCNKKDNNKCAAFIQSLPSDYLLKAESSNLNLYYKNEKIKSADFRISCILNSFNNPSKELSGKFNGLIFNDYSTIDFYSYDDGSVCVAVQDKIR